MSTLYDRYRFFRKHAGYVVGRSAECALALARAEERAEREGLEVKWENEFEPWDGECPEPNVHACAFVPDPTGGSFAALGSIALDSWRDPYMRVVEAELLSEALDEIDARRDSEACRLAGEMSERATFAGVLP